MIIVALETTDHDLITIAVEELMTADGEGRSPYSLNDVCVMGGHVLTSSTVKLLRYCYYHNIGVWLWFRLISCRFCCLFFCLSEFSSGLFVMLHNIRISSRNLRDLLKWNSKKPKRSLVF